MISKASLEECPLLLARLADLDRRLVTATVFLPAYDLRQYSLQIKALGDSLQDRQLSLRPRAKFSFKSKTGGAAGKSKSNLTSLSSSDSVAPAESLAIAHSATPSNRHTFPPPPPNTTQTPALSTATDLLLTRLVSNSINLTPPSINLTSLHIKDAKSSIVLTPRIETSLMVDDCVDCLVIATARQIRIHKTTNSIFLITASSKPIIEDCHGLIFSPIPPSLFDRLHLLPDPTKNQNACEDVQDFNWIKNGQSPNWRLATVEESKVYCARVLSALDSP